MIYMTFRGKYDFINFHYFYFNDLPEDDKYNLTRDLIKEVKDLLII